MLRAIVDGETGPLRDFVLLNAAAPIVAGRVKDLRAGAELAAFAIAFGAAWRSLETLVALTNNIGGRRNPGVVG